MSRRAPLTPSPHPAAGAGLSPWPPWRDLGHVLGARIRVQPDSTPPQVFTVSRLRAQARQEHPAIGTLVCAAPTGVQPRTFTHAVAGRGPLVLLAQVGEVAESPVVCAPGVAQARVGRRDVEEAFHVLEQLAWARPTFSAALAMAATWRHVEHLGAEVLLVLGRVQAATQDPPLSSAIRAA